MNSQTAIPDDYTLMKVGSHRARQRLQRLAGERAVSLLPDVLGRPKSWSAAEGLMAIPDSLVEHAKRIPGVTRSRFSGGLRRPWST